MSYKKKIDTPVLRKYILEIDRAVFKVEPELITKQDEEGPLWGTHALRSLLNAL